SPTFSPSLNQKRFSTQESHLRNGSRCNAGTSDKFIKCRCLIWFDTISDLNHSATRRFLDHIYDCCSFTMSTESNKSTNIATTSANMKLAQTMSTTVTKGFIIGLLLISITNGLHLRRGEDINPASPAKLQTCADINPASPAKLQTSVTTNSTMDFLLMTLDGLDKSMSFFQTELKNINLDAVIGTRIVQASLKVLLERLLRLDLLDSVPAPVIAHIKTLRDVAGEVSDLATPYIAVNEPDYYNRIGAILKEDLFAIDYASRDLMKGAPIWEYRRKEAMEEYNSDLCLSEVFRTCSVGQCHISNKCWQRMTKYGYNRYSLSHQIFYLEIAEKSGCGREIQRQIFLHQQPSLPVLYNTYCANMLAEANLIADNNFPAKQQDLFMEQGALCGMLGFREFFNSDWLIKILSWQDPQDGCYRWDGWPQEIDEVSDLVVNKQYRRRHKREERRDSNGCLCHRTAVAASALSQYVRFILEVWMEEQLY
ncbi:hypothetical protein EGW08_013107, partial [Elysia chlorotica]